MKVVNTYICEKCGKKYSTEYQAIECEKSHPDVVDVQGRYELGGFSRYDHDHYIFYPDYFVVTYSDGVTQGYKHDRTWPS